MREGLVRFQLLLLGEEGIQKSNSYSQSACTGQQIVYSAYHYHHYFFKVEPMFFSLFCNVFCTCLHSRYVRSTEQIGCRDVRTICLHARDNILLVIVNSDVKSFYKTTLLRPCPTWSLMARFSFMSFCHIFSQLWTTKWRRKTLLSPIFHFLESFWAILSHFVTHDLHKREARTGQGTKRRVPLRHLAQGWRSSPSGHGGE